jgi:hypothetical protein
MENGSPVGAEGPHGMSLVDGSGYHGATFEIRSPSDNSIIISFDVNGLEPGEYTTCTPNTGYSSMVACRYGVLYDNGCDMSEGTVWIDHTEQNTFSGRFEASLCTWPADICIRIKQGRFSAKLGDSG